MTLSEALNWIDLHHKLGERVSVTAYRGHVWLSTSTGLQFRVLRSDNETEIAQMYNALQQYIGAHKPGTVGV